MFVCLFVCVCVRLQEMTEEGLPFLILFYHPEHTETKNTFRAKVQEELSHEKGLYIAGLRPTMRMHNIFNHTGVVNFVTADGVRFAHPLSHLGKGKKVINFCQYIPLHYVTDVYQLGPSSDSH